ncbi:metallophosphoesterase family protein [Tardiphaga robiniae]|uniref:Calcineurin-like phosphoesterase domain-containing protein n=1 Tax=Tardiphaga robiniae TaxID=943830 RepID=A0A7G6U3C5_9BRAD|nr:metallophosphoesterase [Tardiphaga robiniae]QND73507.1 hypothetical protein HB776_21595 [Tardiphaga robiniae]
MVEIKKLEASSFTWLHITDLHAGMPSQDWLWPTLKTLLLDDIEKIHKVAGDLDLVIFSGDLTQRGTKSEFDQLDSILGELWSLFQKLGFLPKLFVLPGNHDVQRPPLSSTIRTLKRWWDEPEVQSEFFATKDNEYRNSIESAFREYSAWIDRNTGKNYGLLPTNSGLLPGDQSTVITKENLRIGLVGLNSTWLQLDNDNYESRLHVDTKQLLNVTQQDPDAWCSQNDLNLLVAHHPTSWLHEQSAAHWDNEINPPGRFSAHLFGHVHVPSALVSGQGGSPTRVSLQGISTFGLAKIGPTLDRSHGYSVAKFSQSHKPELKIWPRRLHKNIGAGNNIGPDTGFSLDADNSFTISVTSPRQPNILPANAGTLSEIPHTGTIREALQDAEYAIPVHIAHYRVRNLEQRALLNALERERASWLVAEWGMSEDGFVSSVKRQMGTHAAPVYRLDLGDFVDRKQSRKWSNSNSTARLNVSAN